MRWKSNARRFPVEVIRHRLVEMSELLGLIEDQFVFDLDDTGRRMPLPQRPRQPRLQAQKCEEDPHSSQDHTTG
jgi:hypothetical protein